MMISPLPDRIRHGGARHNAAVCRSSTDIDATWSFHYGDRVRIPQGHSARGIVRDGSGREAFAS